MGTLTCCCWKCKAMQPVWKIMWQFLQTVKCTIKYHRSQQFTPRYVYTQTKTLCPQKKLYMNVHSRITLRVKKWKKSKCPATDWWIKRGIFTPHSLTLITDTCYSLDVTVQYVPAFIWNVQRSQIQTTLTVTKGWLAERKW